MCVSEREGERGSAAFGSQVSVSVGQKGNALRMTSIPAAAEQFSYTRTYLAACTPCTPPYIYPTLSPLHILNNLSDAAAFGLTAGCKDTQREHTLSLIPNHYRLFLLLCHAP